MNSGFRPLPDEAARRHFREWAAKHPDQARSAVGIIRGQIAGISTQRLNRLAFVKIVLPEIRRAREHHSLEQLRDTIGCKRIADWLNEKGLPTQQGKRWSHKQVYELAGVVQSVASDAVLECRTKMTARLLSADFDTNGELESECIDRIVEAMLIGRELDNLPVASSSRLREAARIIAKNTAVQQRKTTYFPMVARECFMTPEEFESFTHLRLEAFDEA